MLIQEYRHGHSYWHHREECSAQGGEEAVRQVTCVLVHFTSTSINHRTSTVVMLILAGFHRGRFHPSTHIAPMLRRLTVPSPSPIFTPLRTCTGVVRTFSKHPWHSYLGRQVLTCILPIDPTRAESRCVIRRGTRKIAAFHLFFGQSRVYQRLVWHLLGVSIPGGREQSA